MKGGKEAGTGRRQERVSGAQISGLMILASGYDVAVNAAARPFDRLILPNGVGFELELRETRAWAIRQRALRGPATNLQFTSNEEVSFRVHEAYSEAIMDQDDFVFTHKGRQVRCKAISTGVSTSGSARPSNAFWTAKVGDKEYETFDAEHDDLDSTDRRDQLRDRIIESLKGQGERFE